MLRKVHFQILFRFYNVKCGFTFGFKTNKWQWKLLYKEYGIKYVFCILYVFLAPPALPRVPLVLRFMRALLHLKFPGFKGVTKFGDVMI